MDISVSRLNKRMALQLPAEFPLGLVFVVGKVRNLTDADGEGGQPFFYLAENDHMLRCHLSERALEEANINEGDMIRAGGHLAFDILQADYFLLARDIEVLPEHRPSRTTLAPILADIKKRSKAANLVPAELPDWVQQIAPLELQTENFNGDSTADSTSILPPLSPDNGLATLIESTPQTKQSPFPGNDLFPEKAPREGLTDDLVAFLSEAMDSPDDVELTQDMVADLSPAIKSDLPLVEPRQPKTETTEPDTQTETRIPWVVVLLILVALVAFLSLILFLAIIVAR